MGRRSALRNRAEWAVAVAFEAAAARLPTGWVLGSMRGLARVSCLLARGRRAKAAERVAHGLGLDPKSSRSRQIVGGAFESLALNAVEPELLTRALSRGEPLERFVAVEGGEHLRRAIDERRGVLLCMGHFGAWELLPLLMERLFEPIWLVWRPLDNPLVERRLIARRLRPARGSLPKEGGGLKLARALRAGDPVGLLLDQNAGQGGVILDFLGAPSSHHKVAGVMARRLGAAVVPVYILREPGLLRFRVIVEPPLRADPALGEEESATDLTRRLSLSLEARVREHPDQWLWLHDRWRHAEYVRALASRGTNEG